MCTIERTKALKVLLDSMEPYLPIKDFNPFQWLQDDRNICLTNGEGSVSLFEYDDGVYNGHYFFSVRGKEAVTLSKECLRIIFEDYDARVVRGYTPVTNRGALWLSRHLGFSPFGFVRIEEEDNQIWLMDRMSYQEKYRGQ